MKSEHLEHADGEHRVVVSMTALEAVLFLRDQPVVTREVRRRIRKALTGCDDLPRGGDQP